jgi:hypothetical protein
MAQQTLSVFQILDMAIVVVAIFAALSCLCSWLYEWIATRLALRGANLFKGIEKLVSDTSLAKDVFNHPLVSNTSPNPDKKLQTGSFFDVVTSAPPSYLDARNFSNAFWQTLHTSEANRTAVAAAATENAQAQADAALAPGQASIPVNPVRPATEAQGLAELLNPANAIAALKTTVDALPENPELRKSLIALITAAGDQYEGLLRATDGWFNAQMDRVSGWYKRRAKTVMFFIALAVVSVSGIDTVAVIKVLSATDPCVLQQMAASAGLLGSDPKAQAAPVTCNPPGQNGNTGQNNGTSGTNTSVKTPAAAPTAPPFDVSKFARLNLRGWENWAPTPPVAGATTPPASKDKVGTALWGPGAHAPGMALTWLAVWLGGPFWFEALLSLVNVRAAGRKPKRNDQPPK